MNEMTPEQRTQAIIDFNKQLDALQSRIAVMTPEELETFSTNIAARKAELGIEQN